MVDLQVWKSRSLESVQKLGEKYLLKKQVALTFIFDHRYFKAWLH